MREGRLQAWSWAGSKAEWLDQVVKALELRQQAINYVACGLEAQVFAGLRERLVAVPVVQEP